MQRRSLFALHMHHVQRCCCLCQRPQGGNPHKGNCPRDQKTLPKGFRQVCQTPALCRSLWSGFIVQVMHPSQPPAWQQGAGISLLPDFSSTWLTFLLQLSFGDLHLIPAAPQWRYVLWSCSSLLERVTSVPQLVLGDMLHLGPTDIHSAGAT